MANEENTVTKVVEGVDKLFNQIVLNGEVVSDTRPQRNVVRNTRPAPVRNTAPVQGEYVGAVQLNNTLHDLKDVALTQVVATLRDNLDTAQTDIGNLQTDLSALQTNVGTINSKIPAQASSSNQLADKNYVNTSIATNTANFLGTYDTLAEIEAIQNPTNNDYAYLQTQTASQLEYDRYKYNSDEDEWLFEYSLIFPIGSGAGVAFIGTRAGYETAKLIPEGEEGHIPSGALVIITDEDDYVEAEER